MKNSGKSGNPTFMDPNNPHWGWSWLERWMAARPWESRSLTDNQASVKSVSLGAGEISKAYARRELNSDKPSPTAQKLNRISHRNSPSTPPAKATTTTTTSLTGKLKSSSPRGGGAWTPDEDARSTVSIQSDKQRRHSVAGSSVRDDESMASSPACPSYMAPTASAKAKTRLQSPLGIEKHEMTTEKGVVESAKKRLSFTGGSPKGGAGQQRRHSGPPKVDSSPPMKDIAMHTEQQSVSNEGTSSR